MFRSSRPPSHAPAPAAEQGNGSGAPGLRPRRRWFARFFRSHRARRLAADHDAEAAVETAVETASVTGDGKNGQVTGDDVLAFAAAAPHPLARPVVAPTIKAPPAPAPPPPPRAVERGDEVVPLSRIRRLTGEHMVRSTATAPHALSVVEVDFHRVEAAREAAGLTFLPFVARAVVDAIARFPHLNATVGVDQLTVHRDVHLGIAVDLDFEGLVVPVVRNADGKRLRAIAAEVRDLAQRARSKRLSPDELAGGTFTITNPGPYGTMLSAPIINQPQVAILATDGVKRRPVVVELDDGSDAIGIHPVGLLALSWDHRAFDGAYASAFLARVRDLLETRDWHAEL